MDLGSVRGLYLETGLQSLAGHLSLKPERERKLASWGEGGPAGLKLVLIVKPTRAIVLAAVESCKK